MGEQWIAYAVDVAPAHLWEGQRQDGWGRVKVARCGFLLDFGPTAFQWDRRPAVIDLCQLCLGSIPVEGAARTETVLEEASRLVDGPRQKAYGHPLVNDSILGAIWSAQLGLPQPIEPRTVALMMVAVKLAREASGMPTRDNLVDIAGYARTAELIAEKMGASVDYVTSDPVHALQPHEFEGIAYGTPDRPCTRLGCGRADRDPIHLTA